MTKCIVIGEQPTESKKKPIEFVKMLAENSLRMCATPDKPTDYEVIELIARDCYNGCDLMFAYNGSRPQGVSILGHWNDGVAE